MLSTYFRVFVSHLYVFFGEMSDDGKNRERQIGPLVGGKLADNTRRTGNSNSAWNLALHLQRPVSEILERDWLWCAHSLPDYFEVLSEEGKKAEVLHSIVLSNNCPFEVSHLSSFVLSFQKASPSPEC